MDKFLKFVGAFAVAAAIAFVLPLIGVVVGVACGWVVAIFFGDTWAAFRAAFGVGPIELWQFGAIVGFVAMFFRVDQQAKKG